MNRIYDVPARYDIMYDLADDFHANFFEWGALL